MLGPVERQGYSQEFTRELKAALQSVTGRLKTSAQVIALACVAGLLALLIWSVVHQQHAPGVGSMAPAFTLQRLEGPARSRLRPTGGSRSC